MTIPYQILTLISCSCLFDVRTLYKAQQNAWVQQKAMDIFLGHDLTRGVQNHILICHCHLFIMLMHHSLFCYNSWNTAQMLLNASKIQHDNLTQSTLLTGFGAESYWITA